MQDEETLQKIEEYVSQFDLDQAYRTPSDGFLHFVWKRQRGLDDLIRQREGKISELILEVNKLRKERDEAIASAKPAKSAK